MDNDTQNTIIEIKALELGELNVVLPLLNEADSYFTDIENKTMDTTDVCKEGTVFTERNVAKWYRHAVVIACFANGSPVGICTLDSFKISPVTTLNNLYVLKDFRRRGLATKIVNFALKTCRERGRHMEYLILSQNETGTKFWDKMTSKINAREFGRTYFLKIK